MAGYHTTPQHTTVQMPKNNLHEENKKLTDTNDQQHDSEIYKTNGCIPSKKNEAMQENPDLANVEDEIDGTRAIAIPDLNVYQQIKTLAQGMMDLALISANANQLRYVLESYDQHPYYYPSLIFISLSIIFQIGIGVGLILNSTYNVIDVIEIGHANEVNNYTVIGIFIITIVNVFISAFGVVDTQSQRNT